MAVPVSVQTVEPTEVPSQPDWAPQACGTAEASAVSLGTGPGQVAGVQVVGTGWCDAAGNLLEGSQPVWARLVVQGGYAGSAVVQTMVTVTGGSFSTAIAQKDLTSGQDGTAGPDLYLKVSVGSSGAVDTGVFSVGAADPEEPSASEAPGGTEPAPGEGQSGEGQSEAPGGTTEPAPGEGQSGENQSEAPGGTEPAPGEDQSEAPGGTTEPAPGEGADSEERDDGEAEAEPDGPETADGPRHSPAPGDMSQSGSQDGSSSAPDEALTSDAPAQAGGSSARADGADSSARRPSGSPVPPVASSAELSGDNAGSLSGSRQGSTVLLYLPADRAAEGDWVSVFVFPGAQSPGWVQVDSHNSVAIDISSLKRGSYELVVVDRDNVLIGWARLEVYQASSKPDVAPVADVYPGAAPSGHRAAPREWLLAAAGGLLVLGAAGSLLVSGAGSRIRGRLRAVAARAVTRS